MARKHSFRFGLPIVFAGALRLSHAPHRGEFRTLLVHILGMRG